MDSVNENWLPHLHPEVISEVEGNYLDAYVVALEGWRRGLTLRWHVKDSEKFKEMKTWYVDRPGQLFSLHSKEKSHYFFRTRGDKVINEAVEKGMNKEITKQMLKEAGIPIPEGKEFTNADSDDEIIRYASSLGYPVVVKPTDGSFGRGVMSDIKTEQELRHSLQYVREQLEEDRIIVEKHIPGNDYRLYVVGDEVVGAILRVPPHVVGDGINSIEALIDIKNAERQLNPILAKFPIQIDQELTNYIKRHGFLLESIPEKDTLVYLHNNSNIYNGGETIDVFDELSLEIKEIAINALKSIPGLKHGVVELIMNERNDTRETFVIGISPTPELGGVLFPVKGNAKDVPASIIDYYFPETKLSTRTNEELYFDMQEALYPLNENVAVTTKVADCPQGKLLGKKIILITDYNHFDNQWIKNKALQYNLHGFIQNGMNDDIEIIVVGQKNAIDIFKADLKEKFVTEHWKLEEYNWNNPIKIGFEIRNLQKDLIEELLYLDKYKKQLEKEQKDLERDYYEMLNSLSWKVTSPIRLVTGKLRSYFKT